MEDFFSKQLLIAHFAFCVCILHAITSIAAFRDTVCAC